MNVNISKEKKFYIQGQQFATRILFIAWLLLIGSPESTLAASKDQTESQHSLDWLRQQIAAGKRPEEVYPLIRERLDDPEKTFEPSEQILLLTNCVRYGQVNAEAMAGKDAVIVLGNTGVGKSTFINYLAGCQLEEKDVEGQFEPILEVSGTSSGGVRNEVTPIGHDRSKTFMPHVVSVDDQVYCDCPGFSDGRGVEINIANAVNIKQALSQAQSLRMVVLVDYSILLANQADGFQNLLRTLTDLLGSEAAIVEHQGSLLLGISKCPDGRTREGLWKCIAPQIPGSLSFLKDRLFVFNPLLPEEGWDRAGCLAALDKLVKVPEPSSILSVSLKGNERDALHSLVEAMGTEIASSLSKGDLSAASARYRDLERLSVIDHQKIKSLFSSTREDILKWVKQQKDKFSLQCNAHCFTEAEKLLSFLRDVASAFSLDTSEIDLSSLHEELERASRSYAENQKQIPSLSQHSLDWLRQQIAAGKSPEEVYPLIKERLDDPKKTFEPSEQILLLTNCMRYGQVNAEAMAGKDAVIVLGNTGTGKSTFINYLAGCQLEKKDVEGQLESVLEVRGTSSDGGRDEVAPIGHEATSKTFMPQIVAVDDQVYCDCPGFRDNRGVEINIANAVNIKQALSQAQSLRMVVLVNYHSLLSDRADGFQNLLHTLKDLLGSEAAIVEHQGSLLLGISKCPNRATREVLWKGIAPHIPGSLSFLKDRLFVFNPLLPEEGWDRTGCLAALDSLVKVSNPSSMLAVSLNDKDLIALHSLVEAMRKEIDYFLFNGDLSAASARYRDLERLSVIDHQKIKSLLSSTREDILKWVKQQKDKFSLQCDAHYFTEAKELLSFLREVASSFSLDTSEIDLSSLDEELKRTRQAHEENRRAYEETQEQISSLKVQIASLDQERLGCFLIDSTVWQNCFGSVGSSPPYPSNIGEVLNRPCPFWGGKRRVKDTHLLALIPSHVAGKPLTLEYLRELIQSPKNGNSASYRNSAYDEEVRNAIGHQSPGKSYWVLMTKDVIPWSKGMSYQRQCKQLSKKAKGFPYKEPGALEAAVVILLHHVWSGERFYDCSYNGVFTDDFNDLRPRGYNTRGWELHPKYTSCRESIGCRQLQVGNFDSSESLFIGYGLSTDSGNSSYDTGLAALRKF